MDLLLKGGRVLEPGGESFQERDIGVTGNKISRVAPGLEGGGGRVVDIRGKLVVPGLVDLHGHLREPGEEGKETIRTGCGAAAAGGFTAVVCMPNTRPVTDNPRKVRAIKEIAQREGVVKVYPVGAVTRGSRGKELAEMGLMGEEGIVAVSDDGRPVMDAGLMASALAYARTFDLPLISHCEDLSLARGGSMYQGLHSFQLGLGGIPGAAESVMVARDLLLAEYTGARLHIAHVSCARSVELIAGAKERGVRVTAEVTPHHLLLTDREVGDFFTGAKMNPPLGGEEDREALREGLKRGIIDIIATDHAPHRQEEKAVEFSRAPFGVVGLETALPLVLTHLVAPGLFTLPEVIKAMSRRPAEILGLEPVRIQGGDPADLTVIDLEEEKTIDRDQFYSRGRNTPFHGWKVRGVPYMTLVEGRIVMEGGKVLYLEGCR